MVTKKQIKDTNVIKTPEVIIQPQFPLDLDVVDIRPATQEEVQFDPFVDQDYTNLSAEDGASIPTATTSDPSTVTSTEAKKNDARLTILSQKARITADGTTVIDVVLSVTGGSGGQYEWRATVKT